MKTRIIFILLIISTLFACTNTEKNKIKDITNAVKISKSVNFKTGVLTINNRFKGIYYDKDLKQEVVYFSDFGRTFIKTFNIKGELMDSVPLANALKELTRKIGFIYPYSKDTVFCGNEYNKIIVIDHNGDVFHTINIDNILPDSLNVYALKRPIPYQCETSQNILFKVHPFDKVLPETYKTDSSYTSYLYGYFNWTRANSTTVGGCGLYIFNAAQKEESGGYDAAIVYWSKMIIPTNDIVKMLKGEYKKKKCKK
jgi:hypothetical protein